MSQPSFSLSRPSHRRKGQSTKQYGMAETYPAKYHTLSFKKTRHGILHLFLFRLLHEGPCERTFRFAINTSIHWRATHRFYVVSILRPSQFFENLRSFVHHRQFPLKHCCGVRCDILPDGLHGYVFSLVSTQHCLV